MSSIAPSLLVERLYAHAAADHPATGERGYAAVVAGALSVAARLRSGRPLNGATVAFLVPPGSGFIEILLGIMIAGGTAVPLSPVHTGPELGTILRNAAPAWLIGTPALLGKLAEAGSDAPLIDAESLTGPLGSGSAKAPPPPSTAPALMLYTSGTTGTPKGVVLTHAAVSATLAALEEAWQWRREDRLLHVLPLHHTHGLVVALLGALWVGASVQFASFEAARVWSSMADATVFMAVPTMYAKLMEAFRAAPAEVQAAWSEGARRLRLATSGSAGLPASLLTAFQGVTGQCSLERYGMTEIGMALSNPYGGPRIPGAVGVPLPGVEVDIVAEHGRAAEAGEPGELRVRTPQMFAGYHGDQAATARSFDEEGRFCTGDTGVRDRAGVVRLLGRTSVDVLKSGGYKISALEIESALREHPAIEEVAVIGIPDQTWGDRVTANVVLRRGSSLGLDELKAWSRTRLAPYKIPRGLHVLEALPRNEMGKVQKQRLLAWQRPEGAGNGGDGDGDGDGNGGGGGSGSGSG
jgi:malonyl-CoA/methylmalonyl-CoA synthetase